MQSAQPSTQLTAGRDIVRGQKNGWAFRYRGLLGVLVLVPAGLLILLTKPLIPPSNGFNLLLDFLAWTSFCAGAAMRIWATCYVGCRKESFLVTTGPYSICRNPLYLGSFLVALSSGLFLKSVVFTAAVGLVALAYMYLTVPSEERVLRALHGSKYDEYCRSTTRFLPRFASFQTPDIVELKVRALGMEGKRMLVWLWLPFLCEVAGYARGAHWWPLLIYLP